MKKLSKIGEFRLAALVAVLSTGAIPSQADEAGNLQEWISGGSLILNERLRYEYVDQDGLDTGSAFTLRSRLGWQTSSMNGYSATVDFENVAVINDESDYGLPGRTRGKGVIADMEVTEINQYFLAYKDETMNAKLGRQRWILDNARFIGNVGWRQNEQTYDAAVFGLTPNSETTLQFGYIDNVNRILGNDGTAAALTNLESDSIIAHGAFKVSPEFNVSAFGYLLDFENAAALSSDTYGFRATGDLPSSEELKFSYAASYAIQGDNGGSPSLANYDADYLAAELKATFAGGSLTAGYELLGSDNGVSFKTPLATLHAFNGWSDKFLATPAAGLEDFYISYGGKLGPVPFAIVYHDFSSDVGGIDYGTEIDGVFKYKLADGLMSVLKVSFYDADSFSADTTKVSLQFDYAFPSK